MSELIDIAGIGAGPFNLSVAALLAPLEHVHSRFYERRTRFSWHPGMMLPGAKLQTSFLKDLVTAADPTSDYSFLAYLVAHRRFYRFINAEFQSIERREFADYLRWVAERLPNLRMGVDVREVRLGEHGFTLLHADASRTHARHLVVGTGASAHVPEWARLHVSHTHCLHSLRYLDRVPDVEGLRVAVIGGGQSGAEIVLDLLSGARGRPGSIAWVSRRQTLEALDESPFSNEFFTPHYVDAFHRLPAARKPPIVTRQKLASDGISPTTLTQLYQTLYNESFLGGDASGEGNDRLRILPHREVRTMEREGNAWSLVAHNGFDGGNERIDADVVILATGNQTSLPECLEPLRERLNLDAEGRYQLHRDFSADWDGPAEHRIYIQNGGRYSHGIADPQLSLTAWRGATIVNSILGRAHYATEDAALPIEWATRDSAEPEPSQVQRVA